MIIQGELLTVAQCLPAEKIRADMQTYEQRIIGIRQKIAFLALELEEANRLYSECRDELDRRIL